VETARDRDRTFLRKLWVAREQRSSRRCKESGLLMTHVEPTDLFVPRTFAQQYGCIADSCGS